MPEGTTTVVLAGRYELGPEIGRGGMAEVHAGRDLELDRPVAIKLLSPPFDRDRAFVRRFRREARAAARLHHPNVVAVFDTGSDAERHFIVTELVEGESLGDLLAREGPLPVERVVDLAGQISRGLAAAHAAGVVHRDVKPGNVMVTGDGRAAKVVDFGIAHAAGSEALTRSGLVLGSAPYLSPEQARGEPGEPRSDLYALGCVLYEMVTGRPPFAGDTPIATVYLHVHASPVPPSAVAPVPPRLEGIILRCLEKAPSDRFASAAVVAEALQAVGPDPTEWLPVTAAPRHRREHDPGRGWLVAGAVGLLVIGAFALSRLSETPQVPEDDAAASGVRTSPSVSGAIGSFGSPSPSAEDSPPPTSAVLDLESAFGGLIASIERASAGDPDAASKLRDAAIKIAEKHGEDKLEDASKEAGKLLEELGKLEEEGRIDPEGAQGVRVALDGLLGVIGVDPSDPGHGDDDDDDDDDD